MVGCNKETVSHKLERLGRQAIRFQSLKLAEAPKIGGAIVFDGLQSFEFSQYFPYWLNAAVHAESSFAFAFTDSPFRRNGTMTLKQRRIRAQLDARFGPRPRGAIRKGTAELLLAIKPFLDLPRISLRSDEHPAYPGAIRDAGLGDIPHHVTPGRDPRTRLNPLFEINLADLLLRHTGSHLKRETIAFSRRRQAALEKAALWAVQRNFMLPRRARSPHGPTPAMLAGVASHRFTFGQIFGRRIFPFEVSLADVHQRQIRRDVRTDLLFGRDRLHRKKYAS